MAFVWSILFWVLVGYIMFSLLGCAHKEPWWTKHNYDPNQPIDLSWVPDIIF